MADNSKVFKVLGKIVITLIIILIGINVLYMMTLCSTRQCSIVNVSTIVLLLWAGAFWLVVVRHSSNKSNKK